MKNNALIHKILDVSFVKTEDLEIQIEEKRVGQGAERIALQHETAEFEIQSLTAGNLGPVSETSQSSMVCHVSKHF